MRPHDHSGRPGQEVPVAPDLQLEQTVDALEQRELGEPDERSGPGPEDQGGAPEDPSPAFDVDLDPQRQGTAEAGAANPD